MTLEQQEKIIIELRKTLLAMRRAAVLITSEYEKKNRELEEALHFDGRSSSQKRENYRWMILKIVLPMPISLFDHKLGQAYAEVEAEISGTFGHMGSLLRCNSYFFDDDAAYFSSSPLSASSANTGNNRANFSRLPIPFSWLNDQPHEKVLEQTNEMAPDVPTTEIQEEKILRPSNGPSTPSTLSTPSTPKAENISPSEYTRSLNSQL
ncbi:hypothetical protein RhiirC2_848017 [Rhizophagus irregularis]|uniref:Uncharacterized protein n=1 Tax=Rhizophagus irregularis TaxID=588596 RepID=A0A2N1NGM4_9GLOM|nr:hypothetical protein RhiirC2_848017 [Rhizophagus irregularis]